MNQMFVALLGIFLLHSSVQAADKIRISTPGDAAHFTMHLAQKRGFLKEEGFRSGTHYDLRTRGEYRSR